MGNFSITKREYYAIEVELLSPLSLSNGDSYYTDLDVLKNAAGEYFIPGTSIAGAFRNYNGKKKNEKCIYGFSKDEDGKMSSVFISDMYLKSGDKGLKISVRDGVKLHYDKTVDNKFDMEIIESGARGVLYISYIKRECDVDDDFYTTIYEIIRGIQNGDIRFGAKKNRGFGRFEIKNIHYSKFEANTGKSDNASVLKDWLSFSGKCADNLDKYQKSKTYDEWTKEYDEWIEEYNKSHEKHKSNEYSSKYIKVTVPLKLTGGISIRKYSAKPGNADFEHITSHGKPVIPGSSWNGAIRSDMVNILKKLGVTAGIGGIDAIIRNWFGCEDEGAMQSMLVISESVIENSSELEVTRNRIDRFTSGTIESALYTERAFFGGNTTLEYMVRKDDSKNYKALLAMMEIVADDIMKGYVAIGGQVSIGRGIFADDVADDGSKIVYSEDFNREEGMAFLYQILKDKGAKSNE